MAWANAQTIQSASDRLKPVFDLKATVTKDRVLPLTNEGTSHGQELPTYIIAPAGWVSLAAFRAAAVGTVCRGWPRIGSIRLTWGFSRCPVGFRDRLPVFALRASAYCQTSAGQADVAFFRRRRRFNDIVVADRGWGRAVLQGSARPAVARLRSASYDVAFFRGAKKWCAIQGSNL